MTLAAMLWVVFFAAVALTIVIGGILAYHWVRFALNAFSTTIAIAVFSSVSMTLLLIMSALLVRISV